MFGIFWYHTHIIICIYNARYCYIMCVRYTENNLNILQLFNVEYYNDIII